MTSEKVLAQQLKGLMEDGLVQRVSYDSIPPKAEYTLTPSGQEIMPAIDALYIWSIRRMNDLKIPIDADNFAVHKEERYKGALKDVVSPDQVWGDDNYRRNAK